MKLISNNCASAYYYKIKNLTYNHPFMWSLIDAAEFINFIKEYDNINYENYKLFELTKNIFNNFIEIDNKIKNKRKIYGLNIDNKFNIYYTHFLYDDSKKEPINIGPDKFYYKNDEYLLSFYKKYYNLSNDKPVFLVFGYEHNNWTEQKIKEITKLNCKYKIIIISKWNIISSDNKNKLIIIDDLKTGFPNPGKVIEKYIKEIDNFIEG